MIESDLQMSIKGLEEDAAHELGDVLSDVVCTLSESEPGLDFRRMHRIVVTTDFAGELKEMSEHDPSGRTITHTEEEYAVTIAKVMLFPLGDDFEIVPIFDAWTLARLVSKNEEGGEERDREDSLTIIHYMHHELSHVHDDNKKIDAIGRFMLRHHYTGKDIFIRPLAEACWSEYIANFLSFETATATAIGDVTKGFTDAIRRTKKDIDSEILSYRYHADLNRLVGVFQRHGEFLAKAAAYVLGYVDGTGKELRELSADAADALSGSYFEGIWGKMHAALQGMREKYPNRWADLTVYDELSAVMEDYYGKMGLVLSNKEGRAYIDVPFRPETTPGIMRLLNNLGR
jgi:hypothetical protein